MQEFGNLILLGSKPPPTVKLCMAGLGKTITLRFYRSWLIPTRGNLFLPVRLLVWADGRGTVAQADSPARAELQGLSNKSY
jgi:hypothetical protein